MAREVTPDVLSSRLGYLLKHAYLRFTEESSRALAPHGIDGRELAVLAVLDANGGLSQLEAAGKLGVDRTTMVAFIDALERKNLVERHRSPKDRRKNIVELTPSGQQRLREAESARRDLERRLLSKLSQVDAARLIQGLQAIAAAPALNDEPSASN